MPTLPYPMPMHAETRLRRDLQALLQHRQVQRAVRAPVRWRGRCVSCAPAQPEWSCASRRQTPASPGPPTHSAISTGSSTAAARRPPSLRRAGRALAWEEVP